MVLLIVIDCSNPWCIFAHGVVSVHISLNIITTTFYITVLTTTSSIAYYNHHSTMILFLSLLLLQLLSTIATNNMYGSQMFSGAYRPEIKLIANDFSAAWLVTKSQLLIAEASIRRAQNMAGATFAVVRHRVDRTYTSVMTRDYFDFFVEHLSSMSNQIPHSNIAIMQEQTKKLNQTAELLQHELFYQYKQDKRLDQTLGILVFSSLAFSVPKNIQQHSDIRIAFFTTTFYSLYRYYRHIIVYVGNEKDRQMVANMKIPAWEVKVLQVPLDAKNYTTALPRESIVDALVSLKEGSPRYQQFQYVYYSEGDQLLHMRHIKDIYNLMDESNGKFSIVPHRMNVSRQCTTLVILIELILPFPSLFLFSLSFTLDVSISTRFTKYNA